MVKVLGEEAGENSKAQIKGSKFAGEALIFGGETLMAMTNDDKEKDIEISKLQGMLYVEKGKGDEVNYYTSWQSNKPTLSEIEYKNEEDSDYDIVKEQNYEYLHSLVLPKIDFSSVYEYTIKSKDRWGNEVETTPFVFYTGVADKTFLRLLEESFVDVFGWAI